jgi:hypothetical protein
VTTSNWIGFTTPIITALVTLLAGWFIGQRITDRWERARKQRELDLSALGELYSSYGEFYAVWKLWNRYRDPGDDRFAEPDTPWELLLRATAAEAGIEALMVKIVTERELAPDEIAALGALRQAYHRLRHVIRRGQGLHWHSSADPDYTAFKGLQTRVAGILTRSSGSRPTPAVAAQNLARVTANRYEQTWPDVAVEIGVYYPDGEEASNLNRPPRRQDEADRMTS